MAEFKLKWTVKKGKDDKFVRRRLSNDSLHQDYIDVEWTHEDGFPADTVEEPVGHPRDEKYEKKEVGTREVIQDQLTVSSQTTDSTVAQMLDEKRERLAASLGIEP